MDKDIIARLRAARSPDRPRPTTATATPSAGAQTPPSSTRCHLLAPTSISLLARLSCAEDNLSSLPTVMFIISSPLGHDRCAILGWACGAVLHVSHLSSCKGFSKHACCMCAHRRRCRAGLCRCVTAFKDRRCLRPTQETHWVPRACARWAECFKQHSCACISSMLVSITDPQLLCMVATSVCFAGSADSCTLDARRRVQDSGLDMLYTTHRQTHWVPSAVKEGRFRRSKLSLAG